jgi:hypothetical protein
MALSDKIQLLFFGKDQISQVVNGAQKSVSRFGKSAKESLGGAGAAADSLKGKIMAIASGVTIGNLAAKAITGGLNVLKSTIASIPEFAARADEIAKTSAKIGIATDTLQKYRYAADLGGVSNETLNTAFKKLNMNLGSGNLVSSMGKINAGLAAQIAAAPNADAAFKNIAAAVSAEGDATQRAAILTTAFGKSGAELIPMLGDLTEQLQNAETYGNIIPEDSIRNAELFNDTVSRVKTMVQGFGDIIRGSVVRYLTPLIEKLQEWIAENRKLIQSKIRDFVKSLAEWIQKIIPKVQAVLGFIEKFGPTILRVVVAIKAVSLAMGILNAVMAANPMTLILAGIAAVIAVVIMAMTHLSNQVGGLGNAFKVVGQTIMKVLLTPINLAITGIVSLLDLLSNLPGVGDLIGSGRDAVKGFQDSMNTLLTGSDSTLFNSGLSAFSDPFNIAKDTESSRQAAAAGTSTAAPSDDSAILSRLDIIAGNTGDTRDAVEGLGGSGKGVPGRLNYAQMGQEDIFSIMRAGL